MDGSDSGLDSPLSDHPSSEFGDDVRTSDHNPSEDEHADTPDMPPAKKQRTSHYSYRVTPGAVSHYEDAQISSDTEGSVPNSPWASGIAPEDNDVHEQVTSCKWLNCGAGDLGNMDKLVQHIHDDHIGIRQKKYACEWEGCPRIGMNHASGYALRAHMRSHTKEKPFFCALPGETVCGCSDLRRSNLFKNAINRLHDLMPLLNICVLFTRRRHCALQIPSPATTHPQA